MSGVGKVRTILSAVALTAATAGCPQAGQALDARHPAGQIDRHYDKYEGGEVIVLKNMSWDAGGSASRIDFEWTKHPGKGGVHLSLSLMTTLERAGSFMQCAQVPFAVNERPLPVVFTETSTPDREMMRHRYEVVFSEEGSATLAAASSISFVLCGAGEVNLLPWQVESVRKFAQL